MSNYTLKVNLAKLEKVGITNLQGQNGVVKCVVIPVEENHLFVSDKGMYLDLVAIETPNNSYGDSHFIKRQLTKEEREQEKTSGQRIGQILGNMKPLIYEGNGATPDGMTTYTQVGATPTAQSVSMPSNNSVEELPF